MMSSNQKKAKTTNSLLCVVRERDLAKVMCFVSADNADSLDWNKTDGRGNTPFSLAVRGDMEEMTRILLGCAHVDVNKPNNELYSPLMYACGWNLVGWSVKKMLLNHPRIDINQADKRGWEPIVFAVKADNVKLTKKLIKHGAKMQPQRVRRLILKKHPSNIFSEEMLDMFEKWYLYLPSWSVKMHSRYPEDFQKEVKTWLLVCKRLKIFPKDMQRYVIEHLSRAWKKREKIGKVLIQE